MIHVFRYRATKTVVYLITDSKDDQEQAGGTFGWSTGDINYWTENCRQSEVMTQEGLLQNAANV